MNDCQFCEGETTEIEEYCHACGLYPVCMGCLTSEWCPNCAPEEDKSK